MKGALCLSSHPASLHTGTCSRCGELRKRRQSPCKQTFMLLMHVTWTLGFNSYEITIFFHSFNCPRQVPKRVRTTVFEGEESAAIGHHVHDLFSEPLGHLRWKIWTKRVCRSLGWVQLPAYRTFHNHCSTDTRRNQRARLPSRPPFRNELCLDEV